MTSPGGEEEDCPALFCESGGLGTQHVVRGRWAQKDEKGYAGILALSPE